MLEEREEMISACNTQEFCPFGRKYIEILPGKNCKGLKGNKVTDHGVPLIRSLRNITITQNIKRDWWKIRNSEKSPENHEEEELYINENIVVWSKGTSEDASKVIKSFTMDAVVQEALWCSFLRPFDESEQNTSEIDRPLAVKQEGVCIVASNNVNVFTGEGSEYVTAIPFNIKKTWPILNGLLFERNLSDKAHSGSISRTPKKGEKPSNLPILFSMLHPLDDIAPVICRTGALSKSLGHSSSVKVTYVTEATQSIVFTSEDPSLVMTYDRLLSTHSIWTVRRALPEEANCVLRGSEANTNLTCPPFEVNNTPSMSKSASTHLSRLSNQSPSLSPFRIRLSKSTSSPSLGQSKLNSPASPLTIFSRTQSPNIASNSFHRLNTQSPASGSANTAYSSTASKNSPGYYARTPLSRSQALGESAVYDLYPPEQLEPIIPEICLDHLWTESGGVSRDGVSGMASNVFLTQDLCGQHYICYFIAFRHQLRCVKFEESNDKSLLIFGSTSTIACNDACVLPKLNMMLILDKSSNLLLYTGLVKISVIHMAGIPSPNHLNISTTGAGNTPAPPPSMVLRPASPLLFSSGPVTSSRPPSAMDVRNFDDEVQMLSPVPTEFNDSSQLIETSLNDDLSFQHPLWPATLICGLKDAVQNRYTVELTDGTLYRASLPPMSATPIIELCLEAIKRILPKDSSMQVLTRWYSIHNAPGSVNGQSEWLQFSRCILSLMGYDVDKLPLTMQNNNQLGSPFLAKKSRPSDQGTDKDWQDLLSSEHHTHFTYSQNHIAGLESSQNLKKSNVEILPIDTGAVLFHQIPAILFALHLVYEELKLNSLVRESLISLAELLYQLSKDLQCDLYRNHYACDWPQLFTKLQHGSCISEESLQKIQHPSLFTKNPPKIIEWLIRYLRKVADLEPFPYLPSVSERTKYVIAMFVVMFETKSTNNIIWSEYLHKISRAGHRSPDLEDSLAPILKQIPRDSAPFERLVLFMHMLESLRGSFCEAVSLLLNEAIYHCRDSPPENWPRSAYLMIGREDIARQKDRVDVPQETPQRDSYVSSVIKGMKDEVDGMECLDAQLLNLRFSEDLRVNEVRRLLQSSRPVRIAIVQRPEVSDHEFIEEQERHLYATCIRTMALPLGRGVFTLSTYSPVPTETLPIPKLCMTGRAPPRNSTVDLTRIDTPSNMSHWPQFHNGVAAGLRIANLTDLNSTWILYNKPKSVDLSNEHAGFLMGLGLNGHLSGLATLNVHDYLSRGHEMTSIGLILGVAAGMRGTMDKTTVKWLSIHVGALLPPTSTELDMSHNIQVAAIVGIGLVYQGTAHRHIAEVLLSEIGRPPGPEMENCTDRESYSLAAGLALGMVMLGKGNQAFGLSDLSIADELCLYMVGGHKRPLTGVNRERYKSPSYQIKEGDSVNIDVTSPGATLALGMMFFNTKNSAVAEWLTAPSTQFLLDFVRPDFLMLRMISKGLVMWNTVQPSEQWINSNLPQIVSTYAFNKLLYENDPDSDIDFETMSQAFCNIIAGACFVLGLKFAGSSNKSAYECLLHIVRKIMKLMSKPALCEQAGKSTVENCLVVIVLSLAMVMAGSGDLEVLRICRHLRSRIGAANSHVLYGSHMANSMAIGLLFMGGGRFTLSTKPESVAAMICAFFPKFPIHSNDNRYHLQALRHLYVLAAEPRVILPKEVKTGLACYVPLEITFKDSDQFVSQKYEAMAPCILPELHTIKRVQIKGLIYWPVTFELEKSCENLLNLLNGTGIMFVKQRAGQISYVKDPKGLRRIPTLTLAQSAPLGKQIKVDDICTFLTDPRIVAFAEHFCSLSHEQEFDMSQFFCKILYECMSQEKMEVLPLLINLQQLKEQVPSRSKCQQLQQLKLIETFYTRISSLYPNLQRHAISKEFLLYLTSSVTKKLKSWLEEDGAKKCLVQYFKRQKFSDPNQLGMLSAFLTWHEVPHPAQLLELPVTDKMSFLELYMKLSKHGMTVASVIELANALKLCASENV